LTNLQKGKTYYARAYYKSGEETAYSKEIKWEQNFTGEWFRLESPKLEADEYMYAGDVSLVSPSGNLTLTGYKVNRFTNQAIVQSYYPGFNQWNPSFFGNRDNPRPFPLLFNPIRAKFVDVSGFQLTLYGAGHLVQSRGQKLFLRTVSLLESSGSWAPYPGADANTASFGIGLYAYILENLANGKLWRFDYSLLKWTSMGEFPYNKPAKFISFNTNNRAFVLIEPADLQASNKELYEYIPAQNRWLKRADFIGENRRNATAFVLRNKLYYGLGQSPTGGQGFRDIWEYNIDTNTWRKAADYPGGGTVDVLSIGVLPNSRTAYIGFGQQVRQTSVGGQDYRVVNDFWQFVPRP